MHKKSVESSDTSPGNPSSTTPTATQEEQVDEVMENNKEKQRKDTNSVISKEELRENSIAKLRAKAQEHRAKVLGTASDKPNSHITHKEEAEDKQETVGGGDA